MDICVYMEIINPMSGLFFFAMLENLRAYIPPFSFSRPVMRYVWSFRSACSPRIKNRSKIVLDLGAIFTPTRNWYSLPRMSYVEPYQSQGTTSQRVAKGSSLPSPHESRPTTYTRPIKNIFNLFDCYQLLLYRICWQIICSGGRRINGFAGSTAT